MAPIDLQRTPSPIRSSPAACPICRTRRDRCRAPRLMMRLETQRRQLVRQRHPARLCSRHPSRCPCGFELVKAFEEWGAMRRFEKAGLPPMDRRPRRSGPLAEQEFDISSIAPKGHHRRLYLRGALAASESALCCAPGHAQTIDACNIVTAAEVTAAVGFTVDNGEHLSAKHPEFCVWSKTGKGRGGRSARVMISDAQKFGVGKTPFAGIDKKPEQGLGDKAYSVPDTRSFGSVDVECGPEGRFIPTRSSPAACPICRTPRD